MFANLISDLLNWENLVRNPVVLVTVAFQIWMLVDAVRREEWIWAVCIFFFWIFSALLYFFLVYRGTPLLTRGFELPGAGSRQRIRELEHQIHHLDKAHHHSQLGDVYFQKGKLEKAEACYRAALERDSGDIDTRAHLGQCLLRFRRPAEALPLLEGACREDPKHDYGHTLMALAEARAALGDKDLARTTLEQVIQAHSYPRARVQLAEICLADSRREQAKSLLLEVLEDHAHAPAFARKRDRVWVWRAKLLLRKV